VRAIKLARERRLLLLALVDGNPRQLKPETALALRAPDFAILMRPDLTDPFSLVRESPTSLSEQDRREGRAFFVEGGVAKRLELALPKRSGRERLSA